jgi:8-oxo-dGTP pyrophosphatase MutT (NUDIX family)
MSPSRPPIRPYVTEGVETVFDGKVFRVERVTRRSGSTGVARHYHRVACDDWVNVVPITREGRLLLVRQERHGVERATLEIPGGVVERGEDALAAAARELREETGSIARAMEPLGWVHPNPATHGNRCHAFVARDVDRVEEPRGDGDEELEVVEVALVEVPDLVRRGELTHALALAALFLAGIPAFVRGSIG